MFRNCKFLENFNKKHLKRDVLLTFLMVNYMVGDSTFGV